MRKVIVILILLFFISLAYAKHYKKMPVKVGPGGCRSFEECERYCTHPAHMKECMEFAEKHGLFEFVGPPGFGMGVMSPMGPPPFIDPSEFARGMPSHIMHRGMMAMRGPPIFPKDIPPEEMLFGIITHEHFPEIREMMEEFSDVCPDEERLAELILGRLYEMREERFPEGDPCFEIKEGMEALSVETMCRPPPHVQMPTCPPNKDELVRICRHEFEMYQPPLEENPEEICERIWEEEKEMILEGCKTMECEKWYEECKAQWVPPEELPVCGDGVCDVGEGQHETYTCILDCGFDCDGDGIRESWVCKECEEGEVMPYVCPDGTEVEWCSCEEGVWVCIMSPEVACPEINVTECELVCEVCEALNVEECVCEPIVPCCGNEICEENETVENCPTDCQVSTITGAVIRGVWKITGAIVEIEEGTCEEWRDKCLEERRICESKEEFMKDCLPRIRSEIEMNKEIAEEECEKQAEWMMREMERVCAEMEREMEICRENVEREREFMEDMLEQCEEMTSDEVMEKVSKMLAREFCMWVMYRPPELPYIPPEEIPMLGPEIVPIVISVRIDISEEEERILKLILEDVYDVTEISGLKIYRATIRADKFEGVKELGFVDDAKLDAHARAMQERRMPFKPEERPRPKPEEVLGMLEAVKMQIPEEFRPWLSYEEREIAEVEKTVKKIERKNILYLARWFLGLAAEQEKTESEKLEEEAAKLNKTIERLTQLTSQLKDADQIALLNEQIDELKDRLEYLEKTAERKRKLSKGIVDLITTLFR
jgi:hypothetical protein